MRSGGARKELRAEADAAAELRTGGARRACGGARSGTEAGGVEPLTTVGVEVELRADSGGGATGATGSVT